MQENLFNCKSIFQVVSTLCKSAVQGIDEGIDTSTASNTVSEKGIIISHYYLLKIFFYKDGFEENVTVFSNNDNEFGL